MSNTLDDYDCCDECGGYGDDYYINDDGELVSACDDCPHNSANWEVKMSNTLLPCPFCGGEQAIKARYIGYGSLGLGSHDEYRVVCKECRASSDEYKSEAKAIAAWNRRADHIRDATKMVSNAPLTLDELRQMDGEPIWVVTLDGTDEPRREMVVFAGKYGIDLICVLNGVETSDYADFDLYNDTWLAYRNKPVKEEHNETD